MLESEDVAAAIGPTPAERGASCLERAWACLRLAREYRETGRLYLCDQQVYYARMWKRMANYWRAFPARLTGP